MVEMIKVLIEKRAYLSNGNILFDVSSYKFYSALSKRSRDQQKTGTR